MVDPSKSTTGGGDGLGSFGGSSSSQSQGTDDDQIFRAMVATVASVNATATTLSHGVRQTLATQVYSLFGAKDKESKDKVDITLVYYFAVHGTSPDTEWSAYGMDYPMVANGRSVAPQQVVRVIGQHRLKKFMGYYTQLAMRMVANSPELAAALGERAARAGLAAGQEYMAIDYVGKDGSLSRSEHVMRVSVRDKLLHHRAQNAYSVSEVRAEAKAPSSHDARAAGGASRPLLSFDA